MNFNELLKYLHLIYKRRYLFLAVSLGVMTAVTVGSYFLPKKYKADSTVFIEKSVINDLVKGIAVTPDMEERIKVLKYALLSRDLISKTLAELDVDVEAKDKSELQKTVSDLQKRTDIQVKGKELFTVSIVDPDPRFAQEYINTLVSKYVEENISGKREETYGANRFLDEQLIHFKKKLDEAEDAIIRYRNEQGIVLSTSEETVLADIQQYRREVENVNLSIDTQRAKASSLQAQLKGIDPTVAIFSEKQKEDRLLRIEEKARQLLLTYTENYPEVVRLKIEADELRKRMAQEEGKGKGEAQVSAEMSTVNPLYQDTRQKLMEAQTEISALESRRARMQQMIAEREGELQNIPENKKRLGVLVQERDSLKKIYEELLMRMGQSEVSKQMEIGDKTTTFRIVDPAVFPNKPVSPDRVKMILLAIAAGLGCGAGLVVLLENTSTSVRDPKQLQAMGIEVLASIPHMTDEVQAARTKRRDVLVYAASAGYFCCFVGLLAFEVVRKMA